MPEAKQAATATSPGPKKRPRWGRRLIFVIALGVIGGFVLTRYEVPPAPQQSVFQTTLEQGYPNIAQAMTVIGAQSASNSIASKQALIEAAAKSGFARLGDESILILARLRAGLAQQSDVVTCASLWNGAGGNLVGAIETLPETQQRDWALLFDQAAIATAQNRPTRPRPTTAEFQAAMNRTIASIPTADLNSIKLVVNQPQLATPDSQCQAARAICSALLRTNRHDAVTITRALMM